ncbi:S-layer family protein [Leptolyngbya cf. ectocarpi LEGE 11479]|uniref:S-layer family protein n=1 Tax=Leptolyngbya cf. ectocarpi LEGE 11479 TaxID=1828722 RepID=A0A928ZUA3_LEPEC|nr:S-layer family protein [Leptolyngbya ectocarpi]MBE9067586.1 S-layer family protein [Leptolyngbya cf. ectocarpi LEGE 11479]
MSGVSHIEQLNSQITTLSETEAAAGSIDIAVEKLRVTDQGLISVSSLGQGDAGNLTIMADQIRLTDSGSLQAEVVAGSQGNIILMADSLLFMRRGALISTNATNEATGGEITIEAPVVLGLDNSDIVANAVQGDGGNISITTQALLGLEFRDFLTPENDITASSQFGLDGIVQIDTPDLEPNQGLIELPSDVTDPSNQISTGCLVAADNSLTVSGRSGLPDSPDIPNSSEVWEDWRPLETEARSATRSMPIENASLTEATDIVIAANGQVEFIAQSETLMAPNQMSCGGRS